MFNPNDIFISLVGNSRLTHLGINLELYNNFSFRDELYINVVYNGDVELGKLECDNLITLSENRGYYGGALDGINYSLKSFIELDRSIAVIHNFDYLFFYDNPFEKLIDEFIKTNKSVLMWKMKNVYPPEQAIFQTDCFVITKEFAKQVYPIIPKDDTTIFYRKALAKVSGADIHIMEEWFFQRLVNIIMPEYLDDLNNHEYTHEMFQQHIKTDHDMVMDKLSCYCFFITGESKNIVEELNAGKTIAVFNPPEKIDRGIYDSRYHSIHTHYYEILRPLLIMFRYNLNNKKFKIIDEFINNKNSINVVEVIAGMLTD